MPGEIPPYYPVPGRGVRPPFAGRWTGWPCATPGRDGTARFPTSPIRSIQPASAWSRRPGRWSRGFLPLPEGRKPRHAATSIAPAPRRRPGGGWSSW